MMRNVSTGAIALAMVLGLNAAYAAPVVYTYGSGAKLFTLDSLPTGPSGTQAFYQPDQDNSSLGLPNLPGNQGVLTETVSGTTVSFSTPTYVAGGTTPNTTIRVENDYSNFNYLGVPAGVQVGIEASTFSGGQPAPIYVNFTDALSYFSINLYRLNSGAGPGSPLTVTSTVTAYSGLNGTGTALGSVTGSIVGGLNFGFTTLELTNLMGAQSFTLQGANGLPNYDDITATVMPAAATVPEPATWAMMVGGFGLIGAAMRRRARTATTFA